MPVLNPDLPLTTKVCVKLFIQLSWVAESLQAACLSLLLFPLSSPPDAVLCFPPQPMYWGERGVPGLLTQTSPSPRKPPTDLLQPPSALSWAIHGLNPAARVSSAPSLQLCSPLTFWENSLNDATIVQTLWRAVLSKAEGRVAWKEHQFTQSLQF